MIVWRWVRGLRWWWQTLIALAAIPLALLLLYVGGRSLQYLVAEGDAGLYAPNTSLLVRVKDLDVHLARLEKTFAWDVIERKLLRDPAIRPKLNALLKGEGLPTLDDLQDPRKRGPFSQANLSRFAGRDVVAGLSDKRFCGATRLGWLEYLATPFAPLVLPRDGETLRVNSRIVVAFRGAIAIGGDKALVEEALRGKGKAPEGSRPVEAVVRFEGPFARYRAMAADFLPHLKLDKARAVRVSVDLDGSAARLDGVLEGVEAAYPGRTPPVELLARAPAATTGVFATTASFRDLYAWGKGQLGTSANAQQAVETLEKGGMSERLLPLIEPGIGVITGYQENEGRLFPAMALMVKSSDPAMAGEALTAVVKKIGGKFGEARFEERPVGTTTLRSVRWPESAGINDFLQPCWAGIEGGLLFGNNPGFLEAVIAAGEGGDLWKDRKAARRLSARLKELSYAESPGMAGGRLLPPLLRESLDGVIQYASRVFAVPSDVELRQSLEREWAEQGRGGMPEDEKIARFLEAREGRVAEFEAELRRSLRGLDPVRWIAFESAEVPGGVSIRLAVGFDNLSER